MLTKLKRHVPFWLRSLLRPVKRIYTASATVLRYYLAYSRYSRTGIVPDAATNLLTPAYVLTNGRLPEFMARRLERQLPPVEVDETKGVLPVLPHAELQAALTNLRRDGIHVFDFRIDLDVCDQLLNFALRTPCTPFGDSTPRDCPPIAFDPGNPTAPTYWFDPQLLAEHEAVQRILADPTMLRLAQAYLRMEPILNIHTMWWSVAYRKSPDYSSAQMFHMDLDRAKFLKFFIYLTDVGSENGPHVYIRGTHRRKPRALVRDDRIPDDIVFANCPTQQVVTLTGPRGTIFAEDTRGLHKGQPVVSGARLVLELEYASDRFGRAEPLIDMNGGFTDAFRAWKERHPRLMCRFSTDKSKSNTSDLRII